MTLFWLIFERSTRWPKKKIGSDLKKEFFLTIEAFLPKIVNFEGPQLGQMMS
jgi:hypothetical protein